MACRIGITSNQEQRKKFWEGQYPNLGDWKILAGPLDTKGEAQILETKFAQDYGCVAHAGGDDPDSPFAKWWVYYFKY